MRGDVRTVAAAAMDVLSDDPSEALWSPMLGGLYLYFRMHVDDPLLDPLVARLRLYLGPGNEKLIGVRGCWMGFYERVVSGGY